MAEGQPSPPPTPQPPVPATAEAPAAAAPRRSWLRENRLKVALGIAVAEGLFVALEEDFSQLTVIVIAIPVILFWLLAGRTLDSELGREISWILAMSQALAVVAAVVAMFIPTLRSCSRASSAPWPHTCSTTTARTSRRARRDSFLLVVGRSQVVRQRVLVPRPQVRILAPQPS